jgi:hypothetical protein
MNNWWRIVLADDSPIPEYVDAWCVNVNREQFSEFYSRLGKWERKHKCGGDHFTLRKIDQDMFQLTVSEKSRLTKDLIDGWIEIKSQASTAVKLNIGTNKASTKYKL